MARYRLIRSGACTGGKGAERWGSIMSTGSTSNGSMTMTMPMHNNVCVSATDWLRTLCATLSPPSPPAPPPSPLFPAMESISSRKMILGAEFRAFLNISFNAFSLSPTYLENNSGPFTARKLREEEEAKAFAIRVLLQPGGPYKRMPLGGLIPRRRKASGC